MKRKTTTKFVQWIAIVIVTLTAAIYQTVVPQIRITQDTVSVDRVNNVKIARQGVLIEYVVRRVVDGDTLVLDNGDRVRLIGIDAPESRLNERAQKMSQETNQSIQVILKMGNESKLFLKKLIEGRKVFAEYDIRQKDRYGRTLAYLYYFPSEHSEGSEDLVLVDRNQGRLVFLNATILRSGYATPLVVKPNVRYAKLFEDLYQKAKIEQSGLWIAQSK